MGSVLTRRDVDELLSPANGACRERVDEEVAQPAAVDLGPVAGPLVLVNERTAPVENARRLGPDVHDAQKRIVEARCVKRRLSGREVNVELASLRPRRRRRIQVVDRGGDPADVEDVGQGQTAEASPHDCDPDVLVQRWGHENEHVRYERVRQERVREITENML